VRAAPFAKAHGVPPTTLVAQMDAGKATYIAVDAGPTNGRQERWLTREQQAAVIVLWRRQGTRHTPCPKCPHLASAAALATADG
jgi:hypothetical protein